MLLDEWLPAVPSPVAIERHVTHVRAPAGAVYAALWRADLGGPIVRALLGLRLLPTALGGSRQARARLVELRAGAKRLTLHKFIDAGFTVLAEHPERELVLGVTGRFWTFGGGIAPTARYRFRAYWLLVRPFSGLLRRVMLGAIRREAEQP